MLAYILQTVTFATLAVKTIVDWPEHQESKRKCLGDAALLLLGLGTLLGGWVATHYDRLASAKREADTTSRADQMRKDFHEQLGSVSEQLQAIKVKGASEPLLLQISSLQKDIADLSHRDTGTTPKKSKPIPKVELTATLWDSDAFKLPIKSASAPIGADRVVTVNFTVMNSTETPLHEAIEGWIRRCEACEFVGPTPPGMLREDDNSPTLQFQLTHMLPHTASGKYTVRIHVPPGFGGIGLDVHLYCDDCSTKDETQRLTVYLVPEP